MRRPFVQRLRQLEMAIAMPRVQFVDRPPLSRDELAVAIILRIRQLAADGRGFGERSPAINAESPSPERQRQQRAIEWANARAEQVAAAGQWAAVVARVQAKGYVGNSRLQNGE